MVLLTLLFLCVCNPTIAQPDLLSWSPLISLFPEFLTNEECDKIIQYTKNSSRYKEDSDGDISVYFDMYPQLPEWLQDIERRIGTVTGQAPHPGEESINIHRIHKHDLSILKNAEACLQVSSSNRLNDCNLAISGVHHDKVQKEYSSVTIIIYLNDVDQGGGTVWPCMSIYSDSNSSQPSFHCEAAFNAGGRWYDGDKAVVLGQYSKRKVSSKLEKSLDQILLAAHYGCVDSTDQPPWIRYPAVRTVARKGSAVVFHHNRPDLSPEVQAWHAGCLPLSGEKWTLQKFKEIPDKFRNGVPQPAKHNTEL